MIFSTNNFYSELILCFCLALQVLLGTPRLIYPPYSDIICPVHGLYYVQQNTLLAHLHFLQTHSHFPPVLRYPALLCKK